MILTARPLTPEAFAAFGQVLMARSEAPHRDEFAAHLDNRRPGARPNLAFIRTRPGARPVTVHRLERHLFSSQTFVPVNGTRYLVVVCPSTPAGDPDLGRLAAFVADGTQAVNYDTGVWHAPNTVVGGPAEFIMLRWDEGTPDDTEFRPLPGPIEVRVEG